MKPRPEMDNAEERPPRISGTLFGFFLALILILGTLASAAVHQAFPDLGTPIQMIPFGLTYGTLIAFLVDRIQRNRIAKGGPAEKFRLAKRERNVAFIVLLVVALGGGYIVGGPRGTVEMTVALTMVLAYTILLALAVRRWHARRRSRR